MNKCEQILVCLFIIFGQMTSAYSQYLPDKKVDWSKIEQRLSDSLKLSYFNKMARNDYLDKDLLDTSNFYNKESVNNYFKTELAKFHLLDLNGDNLIDIIYEGESGELPAVYFLINTGDSLKIGLKVFGFPVNLTFQNKRIKAMQTIIPPCCCGFCYYRDYYSFERPARKNSLIKTDISPSNSSYFSTLIGCRLISFEALGYFTMPQDDNLKEEFVSNQNFYLTLNPRQIVNKEIPDFVDCTYNMVDGNNLVAKFNANAKGVILSNRVSKNGLMYSFIKIQNKESIESIFGKANCYIYGWTLTENIKK